MLFRIHWVRLMLIVLLLAFILLSAMSLAPLYNVREDTVTHHVGVEDKGNEAIVLTPPPLFIISALAQRTSSGEITLVSWVETGEAIDLGNARSRLEENGYEILQLNADEGFLEAQKYFYPLPRFDTAKICYRWENGGPKVLVAVRIYENGIIIAYTWSNGASLGLLAYYDKNMDRPNLVTWAIVKEVLLLLGKSEYVNRIKSGIPQYPNAKYIVIMWSDDEWISGDIEGFYQVASEINGRNVDVVGAGLLVLTGMRTLHGSKLVRLYINNEQLTRFWVNEKTCKYVVVDLKNRGYFNPGVEYNLKLETGGSPDICSVIVIVAILGW